MKYECWRVTEYTDYVKFPFKNTGHEFKVIPMAWDEVIPKHGGVILPSHTQLPIYWYTIASSWI